MEMDLLKYLIAPHEQAQQRDQTVEHSHWNQCSDAQVQYDYARYDQLPRSQPWQQSQQEQQQHHSQQVQLDNDFDHRLSSMPLHFRPSAVNPGRATNGISPLQSSSGDEDVKSQQEAREGNGVLTREQVLQGLAMYPDILAALLSQGNALPSPNTCYESNDHDLIAQNARTPTANTQPILVTDCPVASTPQILASSPSTLPTSSTATAVCPIQIPTGPKAQAVCFFWYHFGTCTRHPSSPNYNGSAQTCPFLHHLNTDAKDMKMQHAPEKWHRGIGDCGLTLCRFSTSYEKNGMQKTAPLARKTTSPAPMTMISAQKTTTPSAIVKPQAVTKTSKAQRKKAKRLAIIAAKMEKQHEYFDVIPSLPTPSNPPNPIPSISLPESPSSNTQLDASPNPSPTTPQNPTPNSTSPQKPKKKTKKQKTCFHWYHNNNCPLPAKKCPDLHRLREHQPAFVQPPRGYMHKEKCTREWCPGDWMWEHDDEEEEEKDRDEEDREGEKLSHGQEAER